MVSVQYLLDHHYRIWKSGSDRRGKNQLRLTDGAHRYHRKKSRRKPTSDLNKALADGALRTSPKKKSSPGHLSRCFLTADSHWLGTRACAVPAISLSLPIDVLGISLQRVPHVEAWRVGCHLSSPPRHSTGVPNDTVCMCVELVTGVLFPSLILAILTVNIFSKNLQDRKYGGSSPLFFRVHSYTKIGPSSPRWEGFSPRCITVNNPQDWNEVVPLDASL
ncbi:uncharacterized protein TNCV_684171 [Trichonephila clavipes]|nr:uncharacterized protein TNCV_684171 [Trichonephila clavipes]